MKTRIAIVLVSLLHAGVLADTSRTKAHVTTLASEKLQCRVTGTAGEGLAVASIASQLNRIGATPLPGHPDDRWPFQFTAGTKDGGSRLRVICGSAGDAPASSADRCEAREFSGAKDIQALSFSDNGDA